MELWFNPLTLNIAWVSKWWIIFDGLFYKV